MGFVLIFAKCTFESRPVPLPLGEKECVGMPQTELAVGLAHHLPQANHRVLFHQEFLNLRTSDY